MIKLIHPKTGTVRDVAETNQNKINLLKRAGFVPLEGYKAPKPPKVVAEPSLAEAVEDNKVDLEDAESEGSEPEIAIHISAAARRMVEKNGLDPGQIKGTGKDGQITKPDVKAFLKEMEAKKAEMEERQAEIIDELNAEEAAKAQEEESTPEEPKSAEDIVTHDDAPKPAEAPETAPEEEPEPEGEEPVVREATEEEEAVEKAMADAVAKVTGEEEDPPAGEDFD